MSDSKNCSICLEAFTIPKGLPCFHTFCQECLQMYINTSVINKGGKSFLCPMCRTDIKPSDPETPTSEWAASFPNNIYIQNENPNEMEEKQSNQSSSVPKPKAERKIDPTPAQQTESVPQPLALITNVSFSEYRFYGVNDLVILPDKGFLISLAYNKTVFRFSSTGNYITKLKYTDSEPFGLCLLQYYNRVAVSQPHAKKVNILDYDNLAEEESFSFDKSYKGLASDDGEKIFCLYRDVNGISVDIISKNNPQSTHQITRVVKLPPSIYTCHEYRLRVLPSSGNMLIINWTNSLNVICIGQNGEEVFKYDGSAAADQPFSSISDIAVNGNYIFVADKTVDKIHRIRHDGSFVDVPLTADDNISAPKKVFVNDENTLAVLYNTYEEPEIKVFSY